MTRPKEPSSRYTSTDKSPENSFYDAEGLVLVNKLGLHDRQALQREEERHYARAYVKLLAQHGRSNAALDSRLIKDVHREIFSPLYEWGGKWRSVSISKEQMTWPPPIFLEGNMATLEKDVLSRFSPQSLQEDKEFCHAVAVIQGEFLAVHPFREGNARTIKLCTDLLACRTGRPPLAYESSVQGREAYIHANKWVVHQVDYAPLERIINEALLRAHAFEPQMAQSNSSADKIEAVMAEIDKDERILSGRIQEQSEEHINDDKLIQED